MKWKIALINIEKLDLIFQKISEAPYLVPILAQNLKIMMILLCQIAQKGN